MQRYNHNSITATDLARNVAQSIDKVRLSGTGLYVTKGKHIVAQLCPPPKPGLPISKLAELLRSLPKLGEDAVVMQQDIHSVRQHAQLPENPWAS